MLSVTAIVIVASIVKVQSQWHAQQAKAPGNWKVPFPAQTHAAQSRSQFGMHHAPSRSQQSMEPSYRFSAFRAERSATEADVVEAAAGAGSAVAAVPAQAAGATESEREVEVPAEVGMTKGPQSALNIFDEPIQACTSDLSPRSIADPWNGYKPGTTDEAQGYCSYDPESPKLCAVVKPFDYKFFGAARWGKVGARCVSVWELPTKEYAKAKGQYKVTSDSAFRFGKFRFELQCSAFPMDVFTSDYTQQEWNNCDSYSKGYLLAVNGYQNLDVVNREGEISTRCFRFRRAMNALCHTCFDQAPSASAKDALRKKCAALDGDAPAVMLLEGSKHSTPLVRVDSSSVSALLASCGLAIILVVFFSRDFYRKRRAGQERLLLAAA